MPFLTLNTTTTLLSLFYTLTGPSTLPPILLLHGWSCDSHDWSFQIPYLAQTHHVITVDMRGHGRSSAPETPAYTPQIFASDAVALLNHLGIREDVVIIGHSLGGVVASTIAVLYPDVVKGVVLVDPAFWLSDETADAMFESLMAAEIPQDWGVLAIQGVYTNRTLEWSKTWYERRMLGTPGHVVRSAIAEVLRKDGLGREKVCREFLKERKVPRLGLFAGEETAEMERSLGLGKLDEIVVVGQVGHWFHHVEFEEVNRLIGGWLERLEGSG